MRFIFIISLTLLLGGCAGLLPRLPSGEVDTGRIVEIASTVADSAVAGVELASDETTDSGDWVGYGVGALLSIVLASITGKAGHALYKSGRVS